jgi:Heterokaryon incompatibility protein (HET)
MPSSARSDRLYQELSCTSADFRLLAILPHPHAPSTSSSPAAAPQLHCILSVIPRSNAPAYYALSYAWGDEADTIPIYVNGQEVLVTRNLCTALEHICKEEEELIIWVDAICINQCDDKEKDEQVKQMKDIYANAKSTIVWLGPAENDSDKIFEEVNGIGDALIKKIFNIGVDGVAVQKSILDILIEMLALPGENTDRYQFLEQTVDDALSEYYDKAENHLTETLSLKRALSKLLDRLYWKRVWIRQEFVVSSEVIIRCGHWTASALCFNAYLLYNNMMNVKIIQRLQNKFEELKEEPALEPTSPRVQSFRDFKGSFFFAFIRVPLNQTGTRLFGSRRRYHNAKTEGGTLWKTQYPLFRILAGQYVQSNIAASDKRDYIFALLGMASDTADLGLTPRYGESNSWVKVFTETARAILERGELDLLSLAQHRPDLARRDVPSWVPDWSRGERGEIARPSGQLPWNSFFNASFGLQLKVPESSGLPPRQIRLFGVIVDKIETVLTPWTPKDDDYTDESKWQLYLSDICKLVQRSNEIHQATGKDIYTRPGDRESASFRVPIADQESSGNHTPLFRRAIQRSETLDPRAPMGKGGSTYVDMMGWQCFRRPFLSTDGYVGLAPSWAEERDVVVLFAGAKFPYVLRRNGDETFEFVGEAYVHGIMYGEFVTEGMNAREGFILS